MDFRGTSGVEVLLIGISILGWAWALRTLFAAREGILWTFKAALIGVFAFIAAQAILIAIGRTRNEAVVGSYIASAGAMVLTPKRTRYVRSDIRKRVIGRDLKGMPYDARKHHIDHIWPHSRGGSNTTDNLRVIGKKENLRKGANKPRLTDWL